MSSAPEPPLPKGMTPPSGPSDADSSSAVTAKDLNYAAALRAWLEDGPLRLEIVSITATERLGVPPRVTVTAYVHGLRKELEDA